MGDWYVIAVQPEDDEPWSDTMDESIEPALMPDSQSQNMDISSALIRPISDSGEEIAASSRPHDDSPENWSSDHNQFEQLDMETNLQGSSRLKMENPNCFLGDADPTINHNGQNARKTPRKSVKDTRCLVPECGKMLVGQKGLANHISHGNGVLKENTNAPTIVAAGYSGNTQAPSKYTLKRNRKSTSDDQQERPCKVRKENDPPNQKQDKAQIPATVLQTEEGRKMYETPSADDTK